MTRAVFLDRDGTLIRSQQDPTLYPEVDQACRMLKAAGFLLIVATNQPDIARERVSRQEVDAVNAELTLRLNLDGVQVCPHDEGGCMCRKPKAGLLNHAAKLWRINMEQSVMVGNESRDSGAGVRAGCGLCLRAPLTLKLADQIIAWKPFEAPCR